jgi:hypothetical protein
MRSKLLLNLFTLFSGSALVYAVNFYSKTDAFKTNFSRNSM